MKLETKLKQYLEENPLARNRVNKVRCISNLIRKTHPVMQQVVPEVMDLIVDEIIALERYYRKILLECPELRGSDYEDKHRYSQQKQIELGYTSGHNQKSVV